MSEQATREKFISWVENLKSLKQGWLDGYGEIPSVEFLNWISEKSSIFDETVYPHVFPTPDGGVTLEWEGNGFYICLNVYKNKEANFLALRTRNDKFEFKKFEFSEDFSLSESWKYLQSLLNKFLRG